MMMLARAAAFTALLTLTVDQRLEAQIGSVRFTIAGGPHAGSYRFDTGQCEVLGGRGGPMSIISMFTPEMQKGGRSDPRSPTSFELYTEPGKGKPDGLALHVESAPALPASGPGIGSTRFRPSCRLLGSEPRSRDAATSPFDRRRPLPPRPSAPKRREGCGSRAAWTARPSATTDRKGHLCGPARRRHEAGGAVERTAIPGEEPTCRVFHSVHPCGRAR